MPIAEAENMMTDKISKTDVWCSFKTFKNDVKSLTDTITPNIAYKIQIHEIKGCRN